MNKLVLKSALAGVLGLGMVTSISLTHAMSFNGEAPSLDDIQKLVDVGEYDKAIMDLKAVLDMDLKNADGWNLLGYTYRKSGQLDLAWDAYERALTLDPDHLGATEYIGELYVTQGNLEQADVQLQKLMVLCPTGCEAYDTLKASIAAAQ
ncbi:tetratricopeptide repeat protein [Curvivirga aplysinae]|uniref:tetratricopeptide repeat protein n=1 Tax=Curvivirga aplysinae TaxID=2529852 RepID=UPI0012BCEE02|nr:tetratricopeptide repeat protein [Curvivirga aplysinae]MTI11313.1 tetratricopeptide repeat protein [Curvivirga aplysinae]